MKNNLTPIALLFMFFLVNRAYGRVIPCTVNAVQIHSGYIINRIWLSNYALPDVAISKVVYSGTVILPADTRTSDPAKIEVMLGMDRKQPFAVVRIPAFVSESGRIRQVTSYELTIDEKPQPQARPEPKTTDVGTSALSTGTWYKIGVTHTGFYKLDYNFISGLGLKPESINPANIRIVGNGGYMLSEDNAVPRPSDLLENSLLVNDNGDNIFDKGESVIFYALGTTAWYKDSINQRFIHQVNIYSDTSCYFISFDSGPGARVTSQAALPAANQIVTSYNYYDMHENELINPANLGRIWYGETFSSQLGNTTQSFNFSIGSMANQMYCAVSFAVISGVTNSSFTADINGNTVGSSTFTIPSSADGNAININYVGGTAACNSSVASVTIKFDPADASSMGYLNYIELNGRAALTMSGDQMAFRDWQSVGAGHIANYKLGSAGNNTTVWDVTDPQKPVILTGNFDGSYYNFTQEASRLHEFAALNATNLPAPVFIKKVRNQNLHGETVADLIIVTNPAFYEQAQKLASYHRSYDNMNVVTATTDEVFNEFASGRQDISAIRDFAKMFYDRAGSDSSKMPHYLMLFGGASYDFKNRLSNNTDFLPVFESSESMKADDAFSTDDFFGFLDNSENIGNPGIVNALDIGIGRLPARNTDDANAMVDKIINYRSAATLGPWRIAASFMADKECVGIKKYDQAGNHMSDAQDMAAGVALYGEGIYNNQKTYVDALPIISTPAGARCPDANAALDEQVFNGTFLINYNGHGNPTVWSSERILTNDDFNNWNNKNMLPFMVTATCDFGQFDHPQFVSSAEQLLERKDGGVIAILTTTQAVFSGPNHELNIQYLYAQFQKNSNGQYNTFGESCRKGKNETYLVSGNPLEIINFRKFSLLGDPALIPDFPKHKVTIDSVFDAHSQKLADTLKALGAYLLKGNVHDINGNVLTGFNGLLYVSIYDKPHSIVTISGCDDTFSVQNNIVYRGRISVTNGRFSFTFITPKDLNYSFGNGKISMYANNEITDAAGTESNIIVGGFSDHPVLNNEPPVVKAYINDSMFLNGGITGSNTSLFVTLYDKTGINVSGTEVGHDLTAVLDGNINTPYILNNYYVTAPDSYQYGFVSFLLNGLTEGPHSITVKAWDVNNNTGSGDVNFVVVNGQIMDIQQLGNYPNPFSNLTHFVFEHNHPDEELNVQITIYNVAGALVKKIDQALTPTGSRTAGIIWDGTADGGGKLPPGMYVYRLNIATATGYKTTAYQKLIILNR